MYQAVFTFSLASFLFHQLLRFIHSTLYHYYHSYPVEFEDACSCFFDLMRCLYDMTDYGDETEVDVRVYICNMLRVYPHWMEPVQISSILPTKRWTYIGNSAVNEG